MKAVVLLVQMALVASALAVAVADQGIHLRDLRPQQQHNIVQTRRQQLNTYNNDNTPTELLQTSDTAYGGMNGANGAATLQANVDTVNNGNNNNVNSLAQTSTNVNNQVNTDTQAASTSLVQQAASSGSGGGGSGDGGGGDGGAFGPCQTCVYVIEHIKENTNLDLPEICNILHETQPESYAQCNEVLEAAADNEKNLRAWLLEGCYKFEVYNAREWIRPCPSHVICAAIYDLDQKRFCAPYPLYDPFAA